MVNRKTIKLPFSLPIEGLAVWCSQFAHFQLLDSNTSKTGQQEKYSEYDFLLAADAVKVITPTTDHFETLRQFRQEQQDWLFGHLSYDLKEPLTGITSPQKDRIEFPLLSFFIPRYVIVGKNSGVEIHYLTEFDDEASIHKMIEDLKQGELQQEVQSPAITLKAKVSRENYVLKAEKFLQHIRRGDIYEANYCIESYATGQPISPVHTFLKLNAISPMPSSAFYRFNDKYLLCASPERFLAKRGQKLISQPIKGTIRRGTTEQEDQTFIQRLKNDPKEQSENVMITDLVRNDLSRVAVRGSVMVEELMAVKTYPRIHQLVTTISAKLSDDKSWTTAIAEAFPMGSMTGAPKRRALEIIDELEDSRRGLYSGSVGYIRPDGDFDFNVVIRSIQYDSQSQQISVMAGSALTAGCDPEKEYEECLLKMATMHAALT